MERLRRRQFQQVRDQVAQAPAFEVRSLLQALVEAPADRGADPLRLALKQRQRGSRG